MLRAPSLRSLPLAVVAGCALLVAAPAARADTVDAASRATARKLGGEAVKLFEAGNFAGRAGEVQHGGLAGARAHAGDLRGALPGQARPPRRGLGALPRGDADAARSRRAPGHAQGAGGGRRRARASSCPPSPRWRSGSTARRGRRRGDRRRQAAPRRAPRREAPGQPRQVHASRPSAPTPTVTKDVVVALGEPARVVLPLPPLPLPPAPRMPLLRRVGWASVGVGGAGIVVGGIAGLVALAKGQTPADGVPAPRLSHHGHAGAGGPLRRGARGQHGGLHPRSRGPRGGHPHRDRLARRRVRLPGRTPRSRAGPLAAQGAPPRRRA